MAYTAVRMTTIWNLNIGRLQLLTLAYMFTVQTNDITLKCKKGIQTQISVNLLAALLVLDQNSVSSS